MSNRVVITGAAGALGSLIIRHLLSSIPASAIIATSRDVSTLANIASQGIETRVANFMKPETLGPAFEGAHTVLIVSIAAIGAARVEAHKNAIDAAIAAGAKRIFYTSHQAASPTSSFWPCPSHAETEAYLESVTASTTKRDVSFTSLRNGLYILALEHFLAPTKKTGKITAPKNGRVAWTRQTDIAEGIARLILSVLHDEPTPEYATLVHPHPIDLAEVARIYSEVKGQPVEYVEVPMEAFKTQMATVPGVTEHRINMIAGLFTAMTKGEFDSSDGLLESLLGRRTKTVKEMLEQTVGEGSQR